MKLSELKTGEQGVIVRVEGNGAIRKRITEMGFVRGKGIRVVKNAPLKDPIEYSIMGYDLSLRKSEAENVIVSQDLKEGEITTCNAFTQEFENPIKDCDKNSVCKESKTITVSLVGNPNCGKTSLFNFICGLDQHVGNYSGVTVDSTEAVVEYGGYSIRFTDLPGTYSLSSYSPEERYMQNYIRDNKPDIVLNIIDGSNLERNLYLTTQLLDLGLDMIVSLNMFDELQSSGSQFNHNAMGKILGVPFIPTVARKGRGIPHILKAIVEKFETENCEKHSIRINYGSDIEQWLEKIEQTVEPLNNTEQQSRFVAIKLLEADQNITSQFTNNDLSEVVNAARKSLEDKYNETCETIFTDARYGVISESLKKTYKPNFKRRKQSDKIDSVLTHKYFGLPIFLLIIWVIFYGTFTFAEYPVMGIEWLIEKLQLLFINLIDDGPFKDLVVDGIIGGVGSVIVFLPNILLLFLFISFLEDSGYMARAAFIMDKLMHKIGLHGKSFIPLIMGFGCSVPAIMSTRIIEDKNNRLLTMLIVPFFSCSARLPVYLLIVGAFFPENGSMMLFIIYLIGILVAIFTSLLFRKVLFNKKDLPFVMELPPYRIPTARSTFKHMWQKGSQYLTKMGGVILVAVVIIWVLSYYPSKEGIINRFTPQTEAATLAYQSNISNGMTKEMAQNRLDSTLTSIDNEIEYTHAAESYLGRIGKSIEPIFKPLGFDWKLSVGLVSGVAAKEVIVSTLGVLHNVDQDDDEIANLGEKLRTERYSDGTKVYNNAVAWSFLMFVLIYFPCLAVVAAVKRESESIWWAILTVGYTSTLAWIISYITYTILN